MKSMNKKQVLFIAILLASGVFAFAKFGSSSVQPTGSSSVQAEASYPAEHVSSAQKHFSKQLEQKEHSVWRTLHTLNLKKDACEKGVETQLKKNGSYKVTHHRLKPEVKALVCETLETFGVNPNKIRIASYTDNSPAAASETTLYINEPLFCMHSEPAQRFVIGHEIHHMINHDPTYDAVMEQQLRLRSRPTGKDHPINQFYRLREERADIQTALTGPEWAEGYVVFMKETLERQGNNAGISHPKNSDRLKLAQDIQKYMKSGTLLTA